MEALINQIKVHFTPSELIEFLGVDFDTLLSSSVLLDLIEENMEELKEEIGYE